MYSHTSSDELPQMRVVYDVVGELKGVINESHFVAIDNLSADKKVRLSLFMNIDLCYLALINSCFRVNRMKLISC